MSPINKPYDSVATEHQASNLEKILEIGNEEGNAPEISANANGNVERNILEPRTPILGDRDEDKSEKTRYTVLSIPEEPPERSWSTSQESRESGFLSNHSENDTDDLPRSDSSDKSDDSEQDPVSFGKRTKKGFKKNDHRSRENLQSLSSQVSASVTDPEAIESVPDDLERVGPKVATSGSAPLPTTQSEPERSKRLSRMEVFYAREGERAACMTFLRDHITRVADKSSLQRAQIETILSDRDFAFHFFKLFDKEGKGQISQESWITILKQNTRQETSYTVSDPSNPEYYGSSSSEERMDIVELLEAIAYLICQDDPIRPETFHRIISSRGVPGKILRLADKNRDGVVSVEEMMNFILTITNPRHLSELTEENLKHLEKVFRENLAKDKEEFTLSEFKKIVPSKNPFFVERAFRIFDRDGNGTVSMAEFIDTMHQFAGQSSDEKLVFLFKVYDLDDDGLIQQSDLREVMKACMEENGMRFDEKEIEDLAQALYEDAAGLAAGEAAMETHGITVEDLKAELSKHDGLLENLSINIGKWLVPPKPPKPRPFTQRLKDCLPHQFSMMYIRNNKQFLFFTLVFIIIINVALFVARAYYFKDFAMLNNFRPNPFYLLSRANGRVLLYNSSLILILILRNTITIMRQLGMATVFPLDNNIYLHKVVGYMIFIQAWIHTIMHLCNFAINVQPDPVRFVQLTSKYWEEFGPLRPGWMNLPYELPPGCTVSNKTFECPTGALVPELNISYCQICNETDSAPWTLFDWILTDRPHVFGLMPGWANPTGVALIIILTIMVMGSLPFVRRGGYFEVFYFSHVLYMGYWILLILHAPEFWKWIIGPGIVFLLEITYRVLSSLMGKGKTTIMAGVVLPSKVTNLIIKRPHNFNFAPGDWVFVKIPVIAKSEWHPFTISSAPEQHGFFTLHIRGVGQWTNRLYSYFEEEYRRQQEGKLEIESGFDRLRGTVHRKYTTMKKALTEYNKHRAVDRDMSNPDFQSIATKYQHDPERSKQRMRIREEKLRARESNGFGSPSSSVKSRGAPSTTAGTNKSFRYMRRQPTMVKYDLDELNSNLNNNNNNKSGLDNPSFARSEVRFDDGSDRFDVVVTDSGKIRRRNIPGPPSTRGDSNMEEDGPGKKMTLKKPLEILVDGPFGAPSSNIFRAEHAVLIGTGIGVTPFASILQSIMLRYWQVKRNCPKCDYSWSDDIAPSMFNLKKVDFYWINRDQKSFEWFVKLLSQLEIEQSEQGGVMGHFLEMHMYITSALQRTDMKAVGLQLALDLLHEKEKRDLVTGLKSRTNAGRPNWNKVFTQIREQRKGRVTVFYCGNPILAKVLRKKCDEFGFMFRKEVF